jgi:hypothetical protein
MQCKALWEKLPERTFVREDYFFQSNTAVRSNIHF